MATGQQPGRQSTQIEISNGSDTGSNHFLRDSLKFQYAYMHIYMIIHAHIFLRYVDIPFDLTFEGIIDFSK